MSRTLTRRHRDHRDVPCRLVRTQARQRLDAVPGLPDDLHAADDASVLLLQYLARFIESSRILVVASYRDLEVRSRPVLASLLGGPVVGAARINLSGLTRDDVSDYIRNAANQLTEMVDDLVSDAMTDALDISVRREAIDLAMVVRAADFGAAVVASALRGDADPIAIV